MVGDGDKSCAKCRGRHARCTWSGLPRELVIERQPVSEDVERAAFLAELQSVEARIQVLQDIRKVLREKCGM